MEQEELASDTKLQYISSGFEALLRDKYCIVENCQYAIFKIVEKLNTSVYVWKRFTEVNLGEP